MFIIINKLENVEHILYQFNILWQLYMQYYIFLKFHNGYIM